MRRLLTLCFIVKDGRILLGMKKRGFGQGRWNGFGGKAGDGEGIEVAARRELKEEAGIDAGALEKRATIEFSNQSGPDIHEVHVFYCEDFGGEPSESEEMRPQWFALSEIPFEQMWPDDSIWLKRFLAGEKLRGKFEFGPEDKILDYELTEVKEI